MNVTEYTIKNWILNSGMNSLPTNLFSIPKWLKSPVSQGLQRIRTWLNQQDVSDRTLAHRLCRFIPAQCPFERKIEIFGHVLLSIPPLCKLNPVYEELMALRFRALCYLAEEWGEDINRYC